MPQLKIHQIRALHWCTEQRMNTALAQVDLTASQGVVMGYLARHDAPCARDVEEFFQASHASIAGILCRLEKKGFIEFRPDPEDRRCKRIFILPKGRECGIVMGNSIRQIRDQMVQDFSPEEREQFAAFLDRAITNLGGAPCRPLLKEDTK